MTRSQHVCCECRRLVDPIIVPCYQSVEGSWDKPESNLGHELIYRCAWCGEVYFPEEVLDLAS